VAALPKDLRTDLLVANSPSQPTLVPWRIHFFKRAKADNPGRGVPAIDFLDGLPPKVAAEMQAVLEAVAAGPPPSFSGGGKWEAMHGGMAGYFEVRVQGGGKNHRLFCVLERDADDLGGSSIVCIDGLSKRDALRRAPATMRGSGGLAPGSRSGGPCSSSSSATANDRADLQIERVGERNQRCQRRIRSLGREQPADRLGFDAGTPSEFRLAEMQLLPALIEGTDDRIDLADSLAGLLVGLSVLRILEAVGKIALCACPGRRHGFMVP